MPEYIKAPFNFVPLNKKVFYPKWAELVSHDIPFSDGESGTIELEIITKTPLFIRNGHTREDAKNKNEIYCSFSRNTSGEYFIPATSLKGMIRNVMEIISFGKMNRISDDRFGFRDLHNRNDYLSVFQSDKVHCGYLKRIDESTVEILDHGIPYRIAHEEIDKILGSTLTDFSGDRKNFWGQEGKKTAWFKYTKIPNGRNLKDTFKEFMPSSKAKVDNRKFVVQDPNGTIKGEIVLTGQPGVREQKYYKKSGSMKWRGKFYEFVFPEKMISTNSINIEKDRRFKDFIFIHRDSYDWSSFRKKQFEQGKPIPIFFVIDNSGKILHWGLSYLYKIPYKFSIKDGLSAAHKTEKVDLAQLIFGDHEAGLKGRVQFSHGFLKEGGLSLKMEPLMGSPKASYYPIYLLQDEINGVLKNEYYNTYHSNSFSLKGWKRYPVHKNVSNFDTVEEKQSKNTSPFIPIREDSRFSTKISFHNLNPAEIGALLLSIKLDGSGYHSIGFAKPYGYGKIKMEIKKGSFAKDDSFYEEAFKQLIKQQIDDWEKSEQLVELFKMSKESSVDNKLVYMSLNEFAEAKSGRENGGNKLALPYYSVFASVKKKESEKKVYEKSGILKERIETKKEAPGEIPGRNKRIIDIQEDWLKAKVIGHKKVRVDGYNYDVLLFIPMAKKNLVLKEGQYIWVKIKQTRKDQTINQVEFQEIV